MAEPQDGIVPEPSEHAHFAIFRVRDPAANARAVAQELAELPALVKKLERANPRAQLRCVVSFGSEFWNFLSPRARPAGFRPFRELEANGRRAPRTDGDVLLHATSKRRDLCFELLRSVRVALGDRVEVMEEVQGFRYLDERDLTGFIDGTENPKGAKTRAGVALIGAEDRAFAGGSFVFTQRYVHELAKWEPLPVPDQEKIIGRRKRDSVELSERAKPPTSHVSRVVIEEDGEELEIVRHSFPYGSLDEAGLFFIAYNKNISTFEKMLARMVGTSGDGLHDHILDFTRAVSGAIFFAPSQKTLRALGRG